MYNTLYDLYFGHDQTPHLDECSPNFVSSSVSPINAAPYAHPVERSFSTKYEFETEMIP